MRKNIFINFITKDVFIDFIQLFSAIYFYLSGLISINEKIEKQKEVVAKAKVKYDATLDELKILMKKKQEMEGKELLDAFMNSDKSLDEIFAFMSGNRQKNEVRELIFQEVHK